MSYIVNEDEDYNIYKMLRIARNLSAKEISAELNVTPAYIHAIETGERKPSEKLLNEYMRVLNVDKEIITTFDKQKSKYNTYEKLLLFLLKLIIKFDQKSSNLD